LRNQWGSQTEHTADDPRTPLQAREATRSLFTANALRHMSDFPAGQFCPVGGWASRLNTAITVCIGYPAQHD
jgi:hypothetical protein